MSPWSAAIGTITLLLFLTACTDYVAEIDDQIKDLTQVVDPTEVVAGIMTDSRDGQTYNIVKIGGQVWMAENLNYETDNSSCYNDSAEYCDKYGRLYTWSSANSVCSDGWHLPSKAEWETLFFAVGGLTVVDRVLKSTSGWMDGNNGTDSFKFSVLPAGGSVGDEGYDASFWTSSEYSRDDAYSMNLGRIVYSGVIAFLGDNVKDRAFSVRCLKDDGVMPESSPSTGLSSSSQKTTSSSSSKVTEPVEETSSSSEILESSSSVSTNIEYGKLTDSRDGQTYKTVTISDQVWMAENLNFKTDSSFCYNNVESYCTKYGRLYRWAAAVGKSESECGYGKTCSLSSGNIQGVCPNGWHLPSGAEWETLFNAVGGSSTAGTKLKSMSGWNGDTDAFGFSALPAGSRYSREHYSNEGSDAYFWSSTEDESNRAYDMHLHYDSDYASLGNFSKGNGFSVRCLKD